MTTSLGHSAVLTGRQLRHLRREPAYLLFTLAQPMVWLILFSQLFTRIVEVPGFGADDYISFLTPGIVVMTAVMTANWAGTSFIEDMGRGVMDRHLVSPIRRSSLIAGVVIYQALITVAQTLIVLGTGWLLGARYPGGALGVLVLTLIAVLLASFFAALSCAMALWVRSQEALIGMSQMLVLPLIFMSSVLMAPGLLPNWIGTVARFNPVDWATVASREVVVVDTDWAAVGLYGALLAVITILAGVLATRAFRSYQRLS